MFIPGIPRTKRKQSRTKGKEIPCRVKFSARNSKDKEVLMENWITSAKADHKSGMSYRAIAKKYDKAYGTVYNAITGDKPEVVGVIGDTHFPFVHPNYIHFLEDTFKKHRVTRIVHIGDMCDFHAISRHQTETDAVDAMTELRLARAQIDLYTKTFPKVDLTLGNHCLIPIRQAASLGIPKEFLKGFKELWKLPSGWNVTEQLIINDVLYEHGINALGFNGALNKAVNAMQSCVIGHAHSGGGCQYKSNSKSIIFGLNVGCGVDIDAYAFAYGKYSKNRETLGCGIVFDSANAIFVPMNDKYFRRGK